MPMRIILITLFSTWFVCALLIVSYYKFRGSESAERAEKVEVKESTPVASVKTPVAEPLTQKSQVSSNDLSKSTTSVSSALPQTSMNREAEPIPRAEFINITDKILDALDETQAVLGRSDSTKIEARMSLSKLDAANKKYDRYQTGKWPESKQKNIAAKISEAYFNYEIYVLGAGVGVSGNTKAAETAADNARKLFAEYKQKGS